MHAQFDTATVLGTVRDSSQSALAGASVSLVNTATGVAQTTFSNGAGDYQFFNVKIGRYKATAEAKGFKKGAAEEFAATVNAQRSPSSKPTTARGAPQWAAGRSWTCR